MLKIGEGKSDGGGYIWWFIPSRNQLQGFQKSPSLMMKPKCGPKMTHQQYG